MFKATWCHTEENAGAVSSGCVLGHTRSESDSTVALPQLTLAQPCGRAATSVPDPSLCPGGGPGSGEEEAACIRHPGVLLCVLFCGVSGSLQGPEQRAPGAGGDESGPEWGASLQPWAGTEGRPAQEQQGAPCSGPDSRSSGSSLRPPLPCGRLSPEVGGVCSRPWGISEPDVCVRAPQGGKVRGGLGVLPAGGGAADSPRAAAAGPMSRLRRPASESELRLVTKAGVTCPTSQNPTRRVVGSAVALPNPGIWGSPGSGPTCLGTRGSCGAHRNRTLPIPLEDRGLVAKWAGPALLQPAEPVPAASVRPRAQPGARRPPRQRGRS